MFTQFSKMTLMSFVFAFGGYHVTASAQAVAPSDGEIVEILKTANDSEIDAAKLAKKRAENPEVKDYAQMMLDQHEMTNKQSKKISKEENIKKKSNDMAKALKDESKTKISDLKKKKGTEFDRSYMEQQVTMHQQLLNELDQTLIPSAQNIGLKTFLQSTRDHIQEHLTKAQSIQANLGGSSETTTE